MSKTKAIVQSTYEGLDFTELRKGDIISVAELERLFGFSRSMNAYSLATMQLCNDISRYFRSIGEIVTVCTRDYAIHILRDSEAAEYNALKFKHGIDTADRAHERALAVDIGNLKQEEVLRHDRKLYIQGRILQSIRVARKKACRVVAHHKGEGMLVLE